MSNSETKIKQNLINNEITESIEEIKLLLGLTSTRDIEVISQLLAENKFNLLRTIQIYMKASLKPTRSQIGKNIKYEEKKETFDEKFVDNPTSNSLSYLNEFPDIEILLKAKQNSNFTLSFNCNNPVLFTNQTVQFSREFIDKVKESFSIKNEIKEKENSKKNVAVLNKGGKFAKKASDFKRDLNKKKNNFNNQKFVNNNKKNEDLYEVDYVPEGNIGNKNNNNQNYNKKNNNFKNKGFVNSTSKSGNYGFSSEYSNGYGNEYSNGYGNDYSNGFVKGTENPTNNNRFKSGYKK